MAKTKTTFFCKNCGFESPKWVGKCPSCEQWNTFTEEKMVQAKNTTWSKSSRKELAVPVKIADISTKEQLRLQLSDSELNQVLGGGVVPGAVVLLGDEPGIG